MLDEGRIKPLFLTPPPHISIPFFNAGRQIEGRKRKFSCPSAGREAGSTRVPGRGGRVGQVQVHPGSGPGGQVYPGVRAGEAGSTRGPSARREARVYPECGQGRPGPGPPGVRAGRPGLPRGPGREARSTRGSGQGRPGPPGVRAGRPGLPGGPGRGGRAKRGAGLPRVRAGEAGSRSTRGPGREAGFTPGSECAKGGQVYPGVRARVPAAGLPGLPPDPAEVTGEKKKGNGKRGGRKKNAGESRTPPSRDEGPTCSRPAPSPPVAARLRGKKAAGARRGPPPRPRAPAARFADRPARGRARARARDKSLCRGLILNRSQRGSCSATYETLTQNQVVYE